MGQSSFILLPKSVKPCDGQTDGLAIANSTLHICCRVQKIIKTAQIGYILLHTLHQ